MSDRTHYPPLSPARIGLAGRCPRCGKGKLFAGFLAIAPSCEACHLDYEFADAGDGPAVFVIMIVGFLIVGMALYVELAYEPPIWLHMVIWLPLVVVTCLGLLRPLKGLMVALQYANRAREGRIDERSLGEPPSDQ